MTTIKEHCGWVKEAWKKAPRKVTEKDELLFLIEEIGEIAEALRKKNGNKPDIDTDLEKEFGDVLLSIMTLANRHGIDLDKAFEKTKRSIEKRYMIK